MSDLVKRSNLSQNSDFCEGFKGNTGIFSHIAISAVWLLLLYILGISIIYYSIIKQKSSYKNTRYKDISSLMSGGIRCEVRNEGSHNGKCPSKKAAVNLTTALVRILFYFSLKLSPNPFTIGSRKYLITDCFPIFTSTEPDKPDITLIPGFVLSTSSFTR